MSKESRRRQRAMRGTAGSGAATGPATTGGATARAATSDAAVAGSPTRSTRTGRPGDRAGRRERSRPGIEPSFLERYRGGIIGLAAVAAVALIGLFVFASATTPAYACSNEWQPDPTQPPAAGASAQPGYVQPDMGQGHVAIGTQVTYTYCPPASGRHYNASGSGPIRPRVYGPDDTVLPEGWIHNLEHGALIVLYRGDGEGATPEGQAALQDFFSSYPPSPVCQVPAGQGNGPVFARFDDMAWPYAALVWGRILPLDSLDTAAIVEFDRTYGEVTNPEKVCTAPPSAAPPSAAPSGSAEPSGG